MHNDYGYRKKEQPTGEEVKNIVAFYSNMDRSNVDVRTDKLLEMTKTGYKKTAMLVFVSTAITSTLIIFSTIFSRNQCRAH